MDKEDVVCRENGLLVIKNEILLFATWMDLEGILQIKHARLRNINTTFSHM